MVISIKNYSYFKLILEFLIIQHQNYLNKTKIHKKMILILLVLTFIVWGSFFFEILYGTKATEQLHQAKVK